MCENPYRKFATEMMVEVSKLLITLSSAFFVISVGLIKVLSDGTIDPIKSFYVLVISWVCLTVSILGGVLALGGMATCAHNKEIFDVDALVVRVPLIVQQALFIVAFIFLAIFAFINH